MRLDHLLSKEKDREFRALKNLIYFKKEVNCLLFNVLYFFALKYEVNSTLKIEMGL